MKYELLEIILQETLGYSIYSLGNKKDGFIYLEELNGKFFVYILERGKRDKEKSFTNFDDAALYLLNSVSESDEIYEIMKSRYLKESLFFENEDFFYINV